MKTYYKIKLFIMGIILLAFFAGSVQATAPVEGEEALFVSSTQPDALLVLDLSGSMEWNPTGDDPIYGSSSACYADTTNCAGRGCNGGFCSSPKSNITTYYSYDATCTADTTNCAGLDCANGFCEQPHNASTYYAASSCNTPDKMSCSGVNCGRSDGFCNQTIAPHTIYAHDSSCTPNAWHCGTGQYYVEQWKKDCKDGYCNKPKSMSTWWGTRSCEYACTTSACGTACTTGSCSNTCTSGGSCQQDCSRLAITKRSVRNILDDNADGNINTTDEGSLGVRFGYMRFYNCQNDDTGNSYSSGCNSLVKAINTNYSTINTVVQAEQASGGTPIGSALKEAKLYLDAHKAADAAKACRSKFVILITDGSDTFACYSDGAECSSARYVNRRQTVARAKALRDAGYRVFVIGFGTAMPPYLRNTLNWTAFYGGTDNPNVANSGSITGYNIATAEDCTAATPADSTKCCNLNSAGCYPTGVTGCTIDASNLTAACYDSDAPYPGTAGKSIGNFRASANDPGYADLSGYAYLAGNADDLVAAVKASINIIREATFSFSQASIQSSRTADENYVYEGSFQPINDDPFWFGHLIKYPINEDGTVGAKLLDAGEVLQGTSYENRNIYTCIGCTSTLTPFSTSIDRSYFGASTDDDRNAIVGYIQGNPTYNPDNWKLGDVFRSTPITIGSPSIFYEDRRDTSSQSVSCTKGLHCATTVTETVNAFGYHRCTHCRSSALGNRLIVTGANDGQFHAFLTSDMTEKWSFIPPNLLSKLANITHSSHPTSLLHQYFVDGPVSAVDAWLGSGDGRSKATSEWKTILVFAEGRGSTDRLWSSSSSCATGLQATYDGSHTNYCGYYALDITNTASPQYMWILNGFSANTAPYMGDSWSKMMMGRVITKSSGTETEKWVGIIGGGYNANSCPSNGTCDIADRRGKGIFVIDLSNGQILWSFNHNEANTTTTTSSNAMRYSMPAPPATVDVDNDGFIDTVYLGDLGGNMWRFNFCTKSMIDSGTACTTSNWSGGLLFDSSSGAIRPVHTGATVSKDNSGNIWVFWGTGDKVDPTAANAQEHFYAVKDDLTSTYTTNNIDTLSSTGQVYNPASTTKVGYRIQLGGGGEKILAEPTVFGGVAYFTSFIPGNANDPCEQAGTAKLNGINFTTGEGVFAGGARSMEIGTGIASAPVVSLAPSGGSSSIYVTVSGGGQTDASTQKVDFDPPGMTNRTNVIYWQDKRVE